VSGERWSTVIDGLTIAKSNYTTGGNIYAENASPTIRNCIIAECTPAGNKYVWCIAGRPRFINDKFKLNIGYIYFDKSSPIIKNATIDQSMGTYALYSTGSRLDIESSYFLRNKQAVYADDSDIVFKNSVFKANNIPIEGDGILKFNSSTIDLINCTIFGNSSSTHSLPVIYCSDTDFDMTNSILRADSSQLDEKIKNFNNSQINVKYCNIQGGWTGGIGNIDKEPNLTPDGHLLPCSPCVDAGNEANSTIFDIDGETRSLPDIGADEYIDSDGDGLPNYFEDKSKTGLPNNDDDQDGYTNKDEYELYSSDPNAVYKTYYVASNGSKAYDGLSWTKPKRYISEAVSDAVDGDKIILAAMNHNDKAVYLNGKAICLQSSSPNDPAIIESTIISYGVILRYGEGRGTKILGININKSLSGTGEPANAVYCVDSQPTIEKCIVKNTMLVDYGKGVYCRLASPMIIDCNISNISGGNGAGFYCRESQPYLIGCNISNNSGDNGAGIFGEMKSSLFVEDCVLSRNLASSTGGAIYCMDSNLAIFNSEISYNSANGSTENVKPAGIYFDGRKINVGSCDFYKNSGTGLFIYHLRAYNPIIENCNFGYSSQSVAVKILPYSFEINDINIAGCFFYGNRAGGLNIDSSMNGEVTLKNCLFSGNYNSGESAFFISTPNATVAIENCTMAHNISGSSSYCGRVFTIYPAQRIGNRIINSIIYGNNSTLNCTDYQEFYLQNSWLISYCDIENLEDQMEMYPSYIWTGNINLDPLFIDNGVWDANGTPGDPANDIWTQGDYHLQSNGWIWFNGGMKSWTDATSRCIDAGNPATPLRDEPIYGDRDPEGLYGINKRINMGAYGGTREASIPPVDWMLEADIDNDGIVDIYDLNFFSEFYLMNLEQVPADFDNDDFVDLSDFAILASEWMNETIWH